MDRGRLAAFHGDILCCRCHIAVYRLLRHKVGTRQKFLLDLSVFPGHNILTDFISQHIRAGDMKRNPGHNAVLTGLDNLCRTVSFGLDVQVEENRITGAGHHGLIAGSAPDQHILRHRNVLPKGKTHRVHNHFFTGKGIFVAASGNAHTAAGELF